jgi:hypothetical protein
MKYILPALLLILAAFPAQAQHELDGKVMHSARASKDAEKLFEDLKEIVGGLEEQNQRHFLAIYSTYSTIAAVKTVQDDVGEAVKACGKENADMKDMMDTRYGKWNDALNPILKEAAGQVDNMIIVQDYEKPKNIKNFLKRIDDVRKKTSESLEKVPVTTKDACQHLHDKMDDTQATLTELLRETLLAIPLTIGTASQVKEADKAEKTEEAAETTETKAEEIKEEIEETPESEQVEEEKPADPENES